MKDDGRNQNVFTERGASASHTAAAEDLVRDALFPPSWTRRWWLKVMWARFARVPGRGDCLVSWSGVSFFVQKNQRVAFVLSTLMWALLLLLFAQEKFSITASFMVALDF